MANLITEVAGQSVFGRIGRSFVGTIIGLALLIGSVVLLFWNEGRAVATAKSLREGAAMVIDVPSDNIDAANDSKLIHVTGDTAASNHRQDPGRRSRRSHRRTALERFLEAAVEPQNRGRPVLSGR